MAGAICLDMSITAERSSRYEALDRVPERAFEAGVSDAFPSGWPLQHVGEVHWELDGSYYLG